MAAVKPKTWAEVSLASDRCELILSGPEISKRIDEDGLDPAIFRLKKVNHLEISKTNLSELPFAIGRLTHMISLLLHTNRLNSIPHIVVAELKLLKHLDLSRNEIVSLPDPFTFSDLLMLNVSSNKLARLPDTFQLPRMTVLDLSHNQFTEVPTILMDGQLVNLHELRLRGNLITDLPATITKLTMLKTLDVEANQIKTVAGEIGDSPKLKDILLKDNPLSDRRFLRLVAGLGHCKPILDYIRNSCPRSDAQASNDGGDRKNKKKIKKKKGGAVDNDDEVNLIADSIRVLKLDPASPVIKVSENAKNTRPFIVCCIIRGLDLKTENNFKHFIKFQTKLHENECKNRTVATIATHDLSKVSGNLLYDARPPATIKIVPLARAKPVSALELFSNLQREAEAVRKEKKRNTYSGIHKFLYLLEGKDLFPCLIDGDNRVISFPPIVNSEITKITEDTTDVLVEITSSSSLAACKEVMTALIRQMVDLRLNPVAAESVDGAEGASEENDVVQYSLVVQQVKIVDKEDQLRVLYPSQPDLPFTDVRIIRD